MNDKEMEKASIRIVEAKKYLKSLTHLILQEQDLSLSVKEGQTNLFLYAWKLFKKYVSERLHSVTLYKPQNQKECDETVSLILGKKKDLARKNTQKDNQEKVY